MSVRIDDMIRALIPLLSLLLLMPAPAMAWGRTGHRLIAQLAEAQLTPQARFAIEQLLAGEPDPSLAGVASWADELRGSDPDLGKRSARWHYVNLGENGCRYVRLRDCRGDDCLVEAIREQTAILADPGKPLQERTQALKFVVHFVGDVHQPLHAGYARDRGGNTVQVNFNGKGSNLHSFWDSGMLASGGLSEDAYLQRLQSLPVAQPTQRRSRALTAAQWAEHSCGIVIQAGFYPATAKLDQDYVQTWLPVAEQSLVQAGRHLADVLNAALPR